MSGKRVSRNRLVRTERFIVAVDVSAIIPDADQSEACYTPDVVTLLREVERRANLGDVAWLKRHGRVYEAIEAM